MDFTSGRFPFSRTFTTTTFDTEFPAASVASKTHCTGPPWALSGVKWTTPVAASNVALRGNDAERVTGPPVPGFAVTVNWPAEPSGIDGELGAVILGFPESSPSVPRSEIAGASA